MIKFTYWQLLEFFDEVKTHKNNLHSCVNFYNDNYKLELNIYSEDNKVIVNYFVEEASLFEIVFTEIFQIDCTKNLLYLHKKDNEEPFEIFIKPEFSISLDFTPTTIKNLKYEY